MYCIPELGIAMLSKCVEQSGLSSHRGCVQAVFASKGCVAASSTVASATNWNNFFISCIDFRPTKHAWSVTWITGFYLEICGLQPECVGNHGHRTEAHGGSSYHRTQQ